MAFGNKLAEMMFEMDYENEKWGYGKICFTKHHKISSSSSVLHYGQSVFEGMKAFINCNGTINIFRPGDHLRRMNRGLYRMCMPPIPIDRVIDGLEDLLICCKDEIPEKSYMYIRPIMIATDETLGSKPAKSYKFMIFLSPIDSSGLFVDEFLKLMIPPDFVRAVEGGIGNVKTSGNYAASMLSVRIANSMGYDECLYLDGRERKYIEECSVSNIFFVVDDVIITPKLTGTILPGITRDSIITIGRQLGHNVLDNYRLNIKDLVYHNELNEIDDIFVCGTAATIKPVKLINYKNTNIIPRDSDGIVSVTDDLRNTLFDIYYGNPNHKWIHEV